jgi:hypothetical protein
MTDDRNRGPRLVMPRRYMIAGTIVTVGALAAAGARAQSAEGGEGGEGGEGAVLEGLDAGAEFLTELGLFEATHRIVAGLYLGGATAAAAEHLEYSHHASYEDIEDDIAARGAPGFEPAVGAFAAAVAAGAPAGEVAQLSEAVLAGVEAARAGAAPADEMKAAEQLLRASAGDYEASVTGGAVTEAQEYRDAWGFAEVARLRLAALAAAPDAEVAAAAGAALAALDPLAEALPGLTATAAPGDPSVILGAAARVELSAYRLSRS